jgi:hypothetical protein
MPPLENEGMQSKRKVFGFAMDTFCRLFNQEKRMLFKFEGRPAAQPLSQGERSEWRQRA